jgi:hypothetical protein
VSAGPIRRRKLFYVKGFDPRGIKFYYMLLKWEAKARAGRDGSRIKVGALKPRWTHGAHCQCRFDLGGGPVEVDYEFLSISDIIGDYFNNGVLIRLLRGLLPALLIFLTGLIFKLLRQSWSFATFSAFPLVVLTLGGGISALLGVALHDLMRLLAMPGWLALAVAFVPLPLLLYALQRWDDKLFVLYVLDIFSFVYETLNGRHMAIDARLIEFAAEVEAALQDDQWDEVLVVAHSAGTLLAVPLVAEVLRRAAPDRLERLSLLTMGGQLNVGFYPVAQQLRRDITTLVESPQLLWVDTYAPQDPINAGRFDPVEQLGLTPRQRCNPHLVSARLPMALSETTYARIRHAYFRLHMQFLMANETGKGLDYYNLLGSTRAFGLEYFNARRPAPEDVPVSPPGQTGAQPAKK